MNPSRRASARWLSLVVIAGACSGGSVGGTDDTAAQSSVPVERCGDAQVGRYSSALFDVAPVQTVAYAPGLLADIYSPADDPACCRAALVWIHGGGFTSGARDGAAELAWGQQMARRGYTLISIDYTLGSGDQFGVAEMDDPERSAVVQEAITDALSAVRWIRSTSIAHRVDTARIAIGGTSAGAMIAMGAALTATREDEEVCAAVSISGALRQEWISPVTPPVLFVHGDADMVVPYESARIALNELRSAGTRVDFVTIEGAGHEITGPPTPEVTEAVASWLAPVAGRSCRG